MKAFLLFALIKVVLASYEVEDLLKDDLIKLPKVPIPIPPIFGRKPILPPKPKIPIGPRLHGPPEPHHHHHRHIPPVLDHHYGPSIPEHHPHVLPHHGHHHLPPPEPTPFHHTPRFFGFKPPRGHIRPKEIPPPPPFVQPELNQFGKKPIQPLRPEMNPVYPVNSFDPRITSGKPEEFPGDLHFITRNQDEEQQPEFSSPPVKSSEPRIPESDDDGILFRSTEEVTENPLYVTKPIVPRLGLPGRPEVSISRQIPVYENVDE